MPSLLVKLKSLLKNKPLSLSEIKYNLPKTPEKRIEKGLVNLINKKKVAMRSDGKYLKL